MRQMSPRLRLTVSVADQMASSGSNFLLVVLVARGANPSELGILLLAYAVLTGSVVMTRSALGAIIGMDHVLAGADTKRVLVSRSTAASMVLSLIPLGILVTWGLILGLDRDVARGVILLGILSPLVIVQDLLRYVAIAAGRPAVALASDSLWLVCCSVGLVLPLAFGVFDESLISGVLAWGIGAFLALIYSIAVVRPGIPIWSGTLRWLRADIRRVHLSLTAAAGSLSQVGNASLVGAALGPQAIGAVRGAGTLFGPLNTITSSIAIALVPEAKRTSPLKADRLFRAATAGMILLTVAWGGTILLVPSEIGSAILGETWGLARALVLATTIEYCGLALWVTASARLRAHDQTRSLLRLKVRHALASAVLPPLAGWYWQSALAFSLALAALGIALGVISTVVSARVTNEAWNVPSHA